jgi:hypothetical protein
VKKKKRRRRRRRRRKREKRANKVKQQFKQKSLCVSKRSDRLPDDFEFENTPRKGEGEWNRK